jgi:hypothetical protein
MVIMVWVTSMWFASVLTRMTARADCREATSSGQTIHRVNLSTIVSMRPRQVHYQSSAVPYTETIANSRTNDTRPE